MKTKDLVNLVLKEFLDWVPEGDNLFPENKHDPRITGYGGSYAIRRFSLELPEKSPSRYLSLSSRRFATNDEYIETVGLPMSPHTDSEWLLEEFLPKVLSLSLTGLENVRTRMDLSAEQKDHIQEVMKEKGTPPYPIRSYKRSALNLASALMGAVPQLNEVRYHINGFFVILDFTCKDHGETQVFRVTMALLPDLIKVPTDAWTSEGCIKLSRRHSLMRTMMRNRARQSTATHQEEPRDYSFIPPKSL